MSIEYIHAFNEICEYIASRKKIKIDNDIIETAMNLGGYSRDVQSKRYCVYLCSCFTRISESINHTIVNRFLLLSSENEMLIRNEISYQFRFFFKEFDENFIRKNFFKIVENYLNENENMCVFLTFESVLINFSKFADLNFLTNLNKILSSIFLSSIPDYYELQVKIIFCILEFRKEASGNKEFVNFVKTFLKEIFLKKSGKTIISKDFITKFESIAEFLENQDEVALLQEVYNYIINYPYEGESLNHKNVKQILYENIINVNEN